MASLTPLRNKARLCIENLTSAPYTLGAGVEFASAPIMRHITLTIFIASLFLSPAGAAVDPNSADKRAVETPELDLLKIRDQIVVDSQKRIQTEILDRMWGQGRASVFVDVDLELLARRKENTRVGAGLAEKYREKGAKGAGFATRFILPGVPKQANINKDPAKEKPEAAQGQTAAQARIDQEETYAQQLNFKKFVVTVIYDQAMVDELQAENAKKKQQAAGDEESAAAEGGEEAQSAEEAPKAEGEDAAAAEAAAAAALGSKTAEQEVIDPIRALILDAMKPYNVAPGDVLFRPARYHVAKKDWWADLMEPKVYIPLLYAILLLLLLSWLFGPLRKFLMKYVEAITKKPAAEVNIESNITPPEDMGEGEDGADESKLDIMIGRKPPDPPPESEEEDEDMEKFEPFAYINEENLKRLANFFLLRREEPWLIATVLSYLPHEYARQVIALFPVELQTKVAMEALKVRQTTREQIRAIDAEIKENIDFVVGGVKRLVSMLEESDPHTRMNILESLKNEKPVVYEYVRQSILLFEDIKDFPDREMQLIVRDLKTEQMAKALQGAPPEVAQKFFNNMSDNASSLLKESMEYIKDLSNALIEEERAKIMEHVKMMEKEGKVQLRSDTEEGPFQEVLATEETRKSRFKKKDVAPAAQEAPQSAAPQPVRDPAAAQGFFNAGAQMLQAGQVDQAVIQLQSAVEKDPQLWQAYQYLGNALYQQGRMAEAVTAFEVVLQNNPDPQLQAWVEQLKQTVR
jgi:TolA-binding protein